MDEIVQKYLSEKYDKEMVDILAIAKQAYANGYKEGEETAKEKIIGMIKGEIK